LTLASFGSYWHHLTLWGDFKNKEIINLEESFLFKSSWQPVAPVWKPMALNTGLSYSRIG
jgi:hypothetical protein